MKDPLSRYLILIGKRPSSALEKNKKDKNKKGGKGGSKKGKGGGKDKTLAKEYVEILLVDPQIQKENKKLVGLRFVDNLTIEHLNFSKITNSTLIHVSPSPKLNFYSSEAQKLIFY